MSDLINVDGADAFDDFAGTLNKLKFTQAEKLAIVESEAVVAERLLKQQTEREDVKNNDLSKIVMKSRGKKGQHYNYEVPGHLTDGITHKPGDLYGIGTRVGFKPYYELLANWQDGGTQIYPAKNFFSVDFVNNATASFKAGDMRVATVATFNAILARKGITE